MTIEPFSPEAEVEALQHRVDRLFSDEHVGVGVEIAVGIKAATAILDSGSQIVEVEGIKYRESTVGANRWRNYSDIACMTERQEALICGVLGAEELDREHPIHLYERVSTKADRRKDATRNFYLAKKGIPNVPILSITNPPGEDANAVHAGGFRGKELDTVKDLELVSGILKSILETTQNVARTEANDKRRKRRRIKGVAAGLIAVIGSGVSAYRYAPDSVSRAWDSSAAERYESDQAANRAEEIAAQEAAAAEQAEIAAEAAQQAAESSARENAAVLEPIARFDSLGLELEVETAPINETFLIENTASFDGIDVPTTNTDSDTDTADIVVEELNNLENLRRLEDSQKLDFAEEQTFNLPDFDPNTQEIKIAHDGGAGTIVIARIVASDSGGYELRTYMVGNSDSESLLADGYSAATNNTEHESIFVQTIPIQS